MAREEYGVDLVANNEISDEAERAAQALDDIPEDVETRFEVSGIDKALAGLDELSQESASAAIAAEELGRALGPELAARADTSALVSELQKLGVTADEVTVNADELAAKLREIDSPDLGGGIGQALGTARGEAEKLSDAARGANSALANMVGNTAQDLGALTGVAGSAGVAIGQMAEYFSDATLGGQKLGAALVDMAKVVGPIAALGLATQVLNGYMETQARRAEAAAERTETLGAAMEGAADDAVGLSDALKNNLDALRDFEATTLLGPTNWMNDIAKAIPLVNRFAQDVEVNLVDALAKADSNMFEFSQAIEGSTDEAQAFLDMLYAQMQAGKITGDEYRAFTQAITQYREAQRAAAQEQKAFNVTTEEANAILGELVTKADPLSRMADTWATLFADMADGSIDTKAAADAVNELADGLGLTEQEVIDLARQHLDDEMASAAEQADALAAGMAAVAEGFDAAAERSAGFRDVIDRMNAATPLTFADRAADTVASFDELKTALSEVQDLGARPLAPTAAADLRGLSEESANVIDAMGSMRDAIQTELVGALESAGGDFDALRDKAGFFRDEITAQFTEAFRQMGLGPDEVDAKVTELLGNLGLLPSQVETQIRLTQAEEAMRKIELFGGALTSLPAEVQAKVAAAVDANDPVAAWNLINEGVQAQGAVPITTTANPEGFTAGMDELTGGQYETTVDVEGNPRPAQGEIEDVERGRYEATVGVDADTALAAGIILAFLAQPRVAPIYADLPNIGVVNTALNLVARARTAPIDAYVRNVPSNSSIANRIGVVRIPVDYYVRHDARTAGSRGGG